MDEFILKNVWGNTSEVTQVHDLQTLMVTTSLQICFLASLKHCRCVSGWQGKDMLLECFGVFDQLASPLHPAGFLAFFKHFQMLPHLLEQAHQLLKTLNDFGSLHLTACEPVLEKHQKQTRIMMLKNR